MSNSTSVIVVDSQAANSLQLSLTGINVSLTIVISSYFKQRLIDMYNFNNLPCPVVMTIQDILNIRDVTSISKLLDLGLEHSIHRIIYNSFRVIPNHSILENTIHNVSSYFYNFCLANNVNLAIVFGHVHGYMFDSLLLEVCKLMDIPSFYTPTISRISGARRSIVDYKNLSCIPISNSKVSQSLLDQYLMTVEFLDSKYYFHSLATRITNRLIDLLQRPFGYTLLGFYLYNPPLITLVIIAL